MEDLNSGDFRAGMNWKVSRSGTQLELEYRSLSYGELDEDLQGRQANIGGQIISLPEDSRKIKARLMMGSSSGSGTKRHGPLLIWYSFPNSEDTDIYDFGYSLQKRSRVKKMSLFSFDALYRLHQDSLQHDYAQLRISKNSTPVGTGTYSRWTLSTRYYTASVDEDDEFRFAKLPPPHTVDVYWSLGWSRIGNGSLRLFTIGPLTGATFYIDPEREDAYGDNDLTDINYIFPNPANMAKGGVESRMSFLLGPLLRWDVNARFEMIFNYAADPKRTTSNFEMRSTFSYTVNDRILVDGNVDYHRTRVDIESPADLDDYRFNIVARYLFEVER